MGQPVTVIERQTTTPGVVRFETNRNLTGMGHKRYLSAADATTPTPADELARRLFDRGGVASLHVYQNIATVQLADGRPPTGIKEIIEDLYLFYTEGVVPEIPEGVAAD
ncbi:MAG: hypothetical protein KDB36_16685 [Acidimicrobiales bacterium]|nr:hypothetical protein [Acidimicrobiales bacterium]